MHGSGWLTYTRPVLCTSLNANLHQAFLIVIDQPPSLTPIIHRCHWARQHLQRPCNFPNLTILLLPCLGRLGETAPSRKRLDESRSRGYDLDSVHADWMQFPCRGIRPSYSESQREGSSCWAAPEERGGSPSSYSTFVR